MPQFPQRVDLLVVGSGPVGSTLARELHDARPDATILMVDVGPRLTEQAGQNTRNLDVEARSKAQEASQGPGGSDELTSPTGRVGEQIAARPGTFLVQQSEVGADSQSGMPAAAMSSAVGGMSAHWTCACPAPGGSEMIDFLDQDTFRTAFERAQSLLHVTQEGFPRTPESELVLSKLSAYFDDGRPADRRVQPMPLSCDPRSEGLPWWGGAAEILGDLAFPDASPTFRLMPETLCRRLIHGGGTITAAELEDLPTGRPATVEVAAVAVCADALRTPQLLWASQIRPAALGRYLNDQPQLISAVALDVDQPELAAAQDAARKPGDLRDALTGVAWVPFHEPEHPYHTQVMQLGASPIQVDDADSVTRPVVGIGYFLAKDIRSEDRVEFSSDRIDRYRMPAMSIHYELSNVDRDNLDRAVESIRACADAIGEFIPAGEPRLLPAGSSMHYQGTVRMGPHDDGTSVCDVNSRVWGFGNLIVGGNGVIPTPTACNPTATAVALAVIAARRLAADFE